MSLRGRPGRRSSRSSRLPVPGPAMRAAAGRLGRRYRSATRGPAPWSAAGSSAAAQPCSAGRSPPPAGHVRAVPMRGPRSAWSCRRGRHAAEGASAFVNPMTALGMVETMRLEGHTALVHTAAASNLGQMLNRLCLEDDVPLVNIVRKPEQEESC